MISRWRFLVVVALLSATVFVMHARNSAEIIPARPPLSSFPSTLNGWTSADIALSKEVLDVLGPGDFLLRRYHEAATNSFVDFFIAYFPSQRSGDTIHSPKNCLPGSGWTPIQSDRITVSLPGQTPFPAEVPVTVILAVREKSASWFCTGIGHTIARWQVSTPRNCIWRRILFGCAAAMGL